MRSLNPTHLAVAASAAVLVAIAAIAQTPADLQGAKTRARISRTRADMRSMHTALEAYFIDLGAYPAMTPFASHAAFDPTVVPVKDAEKFAIPHKLTTPVTYMLELPRDPLAPIPDLPFAYYSNPSGWLLISAGPDGDYDITNPGSVFPGAAPPEGVVIPDTKIEGQTVGLLLSTYDPSNGTISGGDLWRLRCRGASAETKAAMDPAPQSTPAPSTAYDPTNGIRGEAQWGIVPQ